jgi:N-acetylneuraminic acid mutarotase
VTGTGTTIRINAGGAAVSSGGINWLACTSRTNCSNYTQDGVTYVTSTGITLAPNSAPANSSIYQDGRAADVDNGIDTLTFAIGVPNGTYTLRLHFAETSKNAAGQRLFDIVVENVTLATNYDIFAQAAGRWKAAVYQANVTITDGVLNLNLISKLDAARIAGIEIIGSSSGVVNTPTVTATGTSVTNTPTVTSSPTATGTPTSGSKTALFVVSGTSATGADATVLSRLQSLGFTVTVKSQSAAVTADATGKSIVVISSSVSATAVGNKFTNVTVPVLTWEYALYDDLGMTTAQNVVSGQSQIAILAAAHPLAAGLSGNVTVHSAAYAMPIGVVNGNAIKVASLVGNANQSPYFAYDTGATMPGLTAPARRIGFFFNSTASGTVASNSWLLFDAAVTWASGGASTPAATNTPTNTVTNTPTNTVTNTPTNTVTNTPTNTPINSPTASNTPTNTVTNTPTNTPTNTVTNTPTNTVTNTPTNSPTTTPTATNGGSTTVRINAGGTVQTINGVQWAACSSIAACNGYVTGGNAYSEADTNTGIPANMNNAIFQSEWTGGQTTGVPVGGTAFTFNIPVSNGGYEVRLYFVELNKNAANQRLFDVNIEGGANELTNFDIFAQAGGINKVIMRSFPVNITDGNVTIAFIRQVENAKISAIEIVPSGPVAQPTPTVTPISPDSYTNVSWSSVAAQPFSNSEAQAAVVGGKLYSFGGFDSTKSCCTPTQRAYVYDPTLNTWSAIADLPFRAGNGAIGGGVTHAGIATDGTFIYLASGYIASTPGSGQTFGTTQVWRYNPATNTYTELAGLPVARAAGQLYVLNGNLHYVGGTNIQRTTDVTDHYTISLANALNTSNSWTTLAALPNGRHHAGGVTLNGKLYYIGGQKGHDGALVPQDDVHVYTPGTNTWLQETDMPQPRNHMGSSTFVSGGRVIVLGGQGNHGSTLSVSALAYNPVTKVWSNLTNMPTARHSGVGGSINGVLYFSTGGASGTFKGTPN